MIVEDDPTASVLLTSVLETEAIDSHVVDTGADALQYLENNSVDIVLMDLGLPDVSGLELISQALHVSQSTEIIVVTGESSADVALEAVSLGAKDYIVKPIQPERLLITVKNIAERIELNRKVQALENTDSREKNFNDFIGLSNIMQDVYQAIESSALSHENVFIHGEHGSGKSLGAKTIHDLSERADRPFAKIDCKLIDETKAEQELLDALDRSNSGTCYIADVAYLPKPAQMGLLKFIEDPHHDVRLICSSISSALNKVQQGELSEDLYYRLNILPISMPPLRQRGEDIDLLANFFLKQFAKQNQKSFTSFNGNALALMRDYHWPGNIRELQNIVKSVVLLSQDTKVVTQRMLPKDLFKFGSNAANQNNTDSYANGGLFTGHEVIPIRDLEMMAIEHALAVCNGNVQEAALRLKISPATLYRKKPTDS